MDEVALVTELVQHIVFEESYLTSTAYLVGVRHQQLFKGISFEQNLVSHHGAAPELSTWGRQGTRLGSPAGILCRDIDFEGATGPQSLRVAARRHGSQMHRRFLSALHEKIQAGVSWYPM